MAARERELIKLRDFDRHVVAKEDPDVRGWNIVDKAGSIIGKIDELLVDPKAKKVRYMDVNLDSSFTMRDHEVHVLVPIGMAKVHPEKDEVVAGFEKEKLLQCPEILSEVIGRDYEEELLEKIVPAPGKVARNPEDFYQLEHFEPDHFYKGRRLGDKYQIGD